MRLKNWLILTLCMILTLVGVQSSNAQDSIYRTVGNRVRSDILDLAFTYDFRDKTIAFFKMDYPPSYFALEAIKPEASLSLRDFDFIPGDDSAL